MGFPQFGFPHLRFVGKAIGWFIALDHTFFSGLRGGKFDTKPSGRQ